MTLNARVKVGGRLAHDRLLDPSQLGVQSLSLLTAGCVGLTLTLTLTIIFDTIHKASR